jgi:hypothetical protein
MSLRDTFRDDVMTVFQNPEEFAAAHVVDGKTILCVFDEEITDPGNIGKFEGLMKLGKVMFVQESLLPVKPVPGARMNVDGVFYTVTYIEPDNFGMTEIHLERRRT